MGPVLILLPVGRADYLIDGDASGLSFVRQHEKPSVRSAESCQKTHKKPRPEEGRGQADREENNPGKNTYAPGWLKDGISWLR